MKVSQTEVTSSAIDMVKTLQHDLDIVTIAHLLASMLQKENSISGKDKIGLGLDEIKKLLERAHSGGGGGNRNGNGRNRRGNSGGGNRSSRNRSRDNSSRGDSRGDSSNRNRNRSRSRD